ncbi:MAG: PAS domain S-box protein [Gallionella sp.]|nr:PAS domain S-box protein [Gallionella sp.]
MQAKKRRLGLSGKLVLAILAVGAIPLVISLSVAYYRGSSELQEVIGASFHALAEGSAAKVDAELQRIITVDRLLAQQAEDDSKVLAELLGNQPRGKNSSAAQFNWPAIVETEPVIDALKASWVTGTEGGPDVAKTATSSARNTIARVTGLDLNSTTQQHLLHILTPIHDRNKNIPIGWLHRDYDVKKLFDPIIYPIRFGGTGHVMLISNAGAIISCPILVTGSRIEDQTLLALVTHDQAGWTTAENDGHGRSVFSIVGYAPLDGVNSLLPSGESWHMFVWQDSREIFAPAKSLLIGVLLAGLLSLGLLATLSYYASSHIVKPIQRLRREASRIAGGDLSQPLAIHTGDEIEELAGEFDEMRVQLRHHIGALEDKLEGRERHFRALTESANDAIITGAGAGAGAGNIVGWNAAAERLFGYSEAEINGQSLTVLMPERFRNLHREGLARMVAGGVPHIIGKTVELAGLRKDGSEFPLELSLSQWQAADGQFFTAIIRDITKRKQAEETLRENQAEKVRVTEQLIQAEKVTAIGTMVSGIGHEINNPLYVILGRAEAISDENDPSVCKEYARDIIKYSKHISAIVKNLSGYIRPTSQHELEEIDVHEKLAEALAMVKLSQLDDRIEIRQNFAPVPRILAKPEEIQQVFFNVIRNGIQAMAGKMGILEITTSLEDSQVCIHIQDTGTGIRAEHLGKIFDPFFTTKGPDEGQGLGMYIVQKIINKYSGTITLESQLGKGTTVTIRFPGVKPV